MLSLPRPPFLERSDRRALMSWNYAGCRKLPKSGPCALGSAARSEPSSVGWTTKNIALIALFVIDDASSKYPGRDSNPRPPV
jgi:hypothetical protein